MRNSLFYAFLEMLGILLIIAPQYNGEAAAPPKPSDSGALEFPIDCRSFHMKAMKFLLKAFNKCSRELKANVTSDDEYSESIGCAMKCTMRHVGFATEDGYVTNESIRSSIKSFLPVTLIELVGNYVGKNCHEKYGPKLEPSEPLCKSYSEYAFCVQNMIADFLDSDYCMKFDKRGNPKE